MSKLDFDAILARTAAESGMDPKAAKKLQAGAVFEISDELVRFPGNGNHQPHELRRVIVVQAFEYLGTGHPKTVLVVPCSASMNEPGRGNFLVPDDEPAFSKSRVVALTTLVFAALKRDLLAEHWRGQLRPETLGKLQAMLKLLMGI